MDKDELISLLHELAEADLQDGRDIKDHPCSVAIKAINQCYDDINHLRKIASTGGLKYAGSKRTVMLLNMPYHPCY